MYIKIHERNAEGRNREDYLLIECATYKIEHIEHQEIHQGYCFYVGAPPDEVDGRFVADRAIVLRTWDREQKYQDVLIYPVANGYVMNEDGKTVEHFFVRGRTADPT